MQDFYRGNIGWLTPRTIFLTRHGSHAYGTNLPTSDMDAKGICVPPMKYFMGFMHRFEQMEQNEPIDMTIYGISKFFQLAADCNPNIIEVLFTDESDWLVTSTFSQRLMESRERFLSKKAKYTFSGYAIAQLKRIRTHRKWLLNPPKDKPGRADFGLPEQTVLPADQLGAIEAVKAKDPNAQFPEHVMVVYEKERAYTNAMREWQQFENWKKTRNPVRAEIESRYGYDCKHAMHLVRLMRMCREILTDGKVIVKRPDAEELLSIRNGAWDYDRLIEWAERQDADMTALLAFSPLPHSADREALDSLHICLVTEYLRMNP
mgnify:CR=1 FL=1